jgi:hypothetical protein
LPTVGSSLYMGTTTESNLPSVCILGNMLNNTVYKVWLAVLFTTPQAEVGS